MTTPNDAGPPVPVLTPTVASPAPRPPSTRREHGDPCTVILLGATGDLSRKKLLGALYALIQRGLAAPQLTVIGVDRVPLDDDGFRALAKTALDASDEVGPIDDAIWAKLAPRVHYVAGDLTGPAVYAEVLARITALPDAPANRLFYLAVPPSIFTPIVTNLAASGLAPRTELTEVPWSRVVVEKPFGRDLASARALNQTVLAAFAEHQVYRIDHYLGKETVQNMLVFRAANAVFEPIWNRHHVSHVQITAAETVGIESRGGYYEQAGVVRDMFQNHLLQLFALTAMDLPARLGAVEVGAAKLAVLDAVRPLDWNEGVIRGQYAEAGKMAGYRQEAGVPPTSTTPTYAALRLFIDNERWRGVPFYLRSGKRLARRATEIAVELKKPEYLLEGLCGRTAADAVAPNVIVHRVQPNDGISLRFDVKIPGASFELTPELEVSPVDMVFNYADAFGSETHPAYVTLLLDVMIGDGMLFPRTDLVEAGWKLTDPLLNAWDANHGEPLAPYPAGSWGPAAADELLAKDGFAWRRPLDPK